MADISSDCTLKDMTPLAGVNFAVIQTPDDADNADTVEVNDVLGNSGVAVKKVLFAHGTEDPTGTAANVPIGYSDSNDTLTIGGSSTSSRYDIVVFFK